MSVGGCWKQECQTTAGCMCGRSPTSFAPYINVPPVGPIVDGRWALTPDKIWYVVRPRDWVDVIAGTADG